MQFKRESFFRCVFTSPSSRRVAHVRAWDVGEAVQLFRTELRTEGVDETGTIEAVPLGDSGQAESAAYGP